MSLAFFPEVGCWYGVLVLLTTSVVFLHLSTDLYEQSHETKFICFDGTKSSKNTNFVSAHATEHDYTCNGKDSWSGSPVSSNLKIVADDSMRIKSAVITMNVWSKVVTKEFSGGIKLPTDRYRELCFSRLNGKDNPRFDFLGDGDYDYIFFKNRVDQFNLTSLPNEFEIVVYNIQGALTNRTSELFNLTCEQTRSDAQNN